MNPDASHHNWKTIKLGDIAVARGGSVDPSKFGDEEFDLYSIPAFDAGEPQIALGEEIGSSKKTVRPNDVLVSRIIPHIQRVCIVGESRGRRQIGSGEWIVFRGQGIDPAYLRYVLLTKRFHTAFLATVSGVGGSLLRARPAEVANIEIPLPPVEDQRRIAAILDKADAIRRKREEALSLADDFLRSAFLEMFGDPVINAMGWPTHELGSVCSKVTDGTHDTPPRLEEGIKFLTGKNIRPYKIDLSKLEYVSQEVHEEIYRRCNPEYGDVLYTNIGANTGTAAFNNLTEEFSMKNVALLKPKNEVLTGKYLEHTLNHKGFKETLLRKLSFGGAQGFLGLKEINKIVLPVPPVAKQVGFLNIHKKTDELRRFIACSVDEAERLFGSLSQRAFKGDL